jgi:hypothetical protein
MSTVEPAPSSVFENLSTGKILPLKGGSFALRIAGRAGRPILIYGFRTPGEAEAWYSRMDPRHAE